MCRCRRRAGEREAADGERGAEEEGAEFGTILYCAEPLIPSSVPVDMSEGGAENNSAPSCLHSVPGGRAQG